MLTIGMLTRMYLNSYFDSKNEVTNFVLKQNSFNLMNMIINEFPTVFTIKRLHIICTMFININSDIFFQLICLEGNNQN